MTCFLLSARGTAAPRLYIWPVSVFKSTPFTREVRAVKSRIAMIAVVVAVFCTAHSTSAQNEITLLSPNPIETTINKLVADFEAKTGTHVKVTYGTGVSTRKTVASGGALDVTLLFAPFPEALATGNIDKPSAKV